LESFPQRADSIARFDNPRGRRVWGRARVPGAWGDAGEVPGSRATARGVAGGRFARTLPPIVSRLLAAPEACARTARKMKKGGRETSVRMRNGGGGGEGSSERRETRALGSGHATGSALGRRPDSSARDVFQTRPPGRISRGFFLTTRENQKEHRALFKAKAFRISPRARSRGAQKRARERGRDASRRDRGDAHLGGYVGLSAT
jgi:hypothetical protein